MALLEASAGDAHKLGLLVELLNAGAAGVAHAGTQAADHLIDGVGQGALEGHTALYPFGYQLAGVSLENGRVLDSVTSPTVGVFYAAAAENADPYVKVGDVVHKGTVLCIIEAMKLMNEVLAEKDGVIEAICAKNGQIVEYGTGLFRIKELSA